MFNARTSKWDNPAAEGQETSFSSPMGEKTLLWLFHPRISPSNRGLLQPSPGWTQAGELAISLALSMQLSLSSFSLFLPLVMESMSGTNLPHYHSKRWPWVISQLVVCPPYLHTRLWFGFYICGHGR